MASVEYATVQKIYEIAYRDVSLRQADALLSIVMHTIHVSSLASQKRKVLFC